MIFENGRKLLLWLGSLGHIQSDGEADTIFHRDPLVLHVHSVGRRRRRIECKPTLCSGAQQRYDGDVAHHDAPNGSSSDGLCGVNSSAPLSVMCMSSSRRMPNSPGM